MEIEKSYNVCPICGLSSETTSLVCSRHLSIAYDSFGKPVSWVDFKEPNYFTVYNRFIEELNGNKTT